MLIVVSAFIVIGIVSRGVLKELYLVGFLMVSIAQLRYRTLGGWILLFGSCVLYTAVAAYQVAMAFLYGATATHVRVYSTIFLACGFISAMALFAARPWRPAVQH